MTEMRQNQLKRTSFLLEKFPGKGGWTYISLPEIPMDPSAPFGWVVVSGQIDEQSLCKVKLMPMGNGKLFLPVNATLRKSLQKQAGDWVKLSLYIDDGVLPIPDDLTAVYADEYDLYITFQELTDDTKNKYLKSIAAAKTEASRVKRMLAMLVDLEKGVA